MGGQKTREEIRALIAEGWKFRKKARKNIIYISARRRGKEESLGAFNPEYWAMIEATKKDSNTDQSGSKMTKTTEMHEASKYPSLKTFDEIIRKMH